MYGRRLRCKQVALHRQRTRYRIRQRLLRRQILRFQQRKIFEPDWANSAEAVPYANFTNPQSLNLYGYVLNNPLTSVDKNGHVNWRGFKNAVGTITKSVSIKVNAGVGLKESFGTKSTGLSVGVSATVFASFSANGVSTGSDLKAGVEINTPKTGSIGKGITQETVSKENGVNLPQPGETTTEDDSGIGALTNSSSTLSFGDETAAGPDFGIEININKSGFTQGLQDVVKALKAPSATQSTPPQPTPPQTTKQGAT